MSLGNNRDYKTNARRVNTNLATHAELLSRFVEDGMSREEADKKAFHLVMNPTRAYSDDALAAVKAGVKEKDFLADVPEGLRKGARLAYRMAKHMCPKCHGKLESVKDERGYEIFRCGQGGHVQEYAVTESYCYTNFPKRKV